MEFFSHNTSDFCSDPSGDVIMEIISGATRFKIMVQCVEAGVFDDLETHPDGCSVESFAKTNGYNPQIARKLLNTLVNFQLIQRKQNTHGEYIYKNSVGTSRYLTRSRPHSMIPLVLTEQNMILPMLDAIGKMLKPGAAENESTICTKSPVDVQERCKNTNLKLEEQNLLNNRQKIHNNLRNKPSDFAQPMTKHTNPKLANGLPESEIIENVKSVPKSLPTNNDDISKNSTMNNLSPDKMDLKTKMAMMAKMGHKEKMAMVGQMFAKMLTSYDGFSAYTKTALVKAFDLSPFKHVVDLGGGSGKISLALAHHYEDLSVTVFDLPPVTQLAKKMMSANEDVQFVTGDLLEDDYPEGDLFLMSHVLHCFKGADADLILNKIFQKLVPGGGLLVFEKILDEGQTSPSSAVTNDFVLSIMNKGLERTEVEYQKLLAKHGFCNFSVRRLSGKNYFDAILVRKPF